MRKPVDTSKSYRYMSSDDRNDEFRRKKLFFHEHECCDKWIQYKSWM